MPTSPLLAFPLPVPCRACGGTILYIGRGRRPSVCSPKCRLAARADDRAAQRFAARVREEATARYWQLDAPGAVTLDDVEPSLSDPLDPEPLPLVGIRLSKGGTVWEDRKATPRGKDAAAQWLAQNHPGELADFPADVR